MAEPANGGEVMTIGYQHATLPEVVARLKDAGVTLLVDVRAVAASRRAGFAKRALAAGLEEAGIGYLHLRALGTPKPGREAARKGRIDEMREIYETQLATPEAIDAMAALEEAVTGSRAALLCFEAQAWECHRRVLTERLEARLGLTVRDL